MKKVLTFIFCMMFAVTIYADLYTLQSTANTGDTIKAADRNTEFQAVQTVINGNLTGPDNIKDGSIRDEDINASYPIDISKLAGSSTTETLQDVLNNDGTLDSQGWIQGCVINRKDTDEIYIQPGSIAIGNNLYSESAVITVDIDVAYSAASSVGGKDSATTYNDGDWVYVFLCVNTSDVDGFNVNLSENASPTDRTVGSNARCIGGFEWDTTNGPQQIYQYRPEGVYGWNYIVGDGSASADASNVAFNVTFTTTPMVISGFCGSKATSTQPTDLNVFDTAASECVAISGITSTNMDVRIWEVSNGNTSAATNYAYTFFAGGEWNLP